MFKKRKEKIAALPKNPKSWWNSNAKKKVLQLVNYLNDFLWIAINEKLMNITKMYQHLILG
jgi:hypothetical protein